MRKLTNLKYIAEHPEEYTNVSKHNFNKPTNKMKNLTKAQLKAILEKHEYVLLRDRNGEQFGINSKCMNLALKRINFKDNDESKYLSYRPVSFIEYINYKTPFI